ncbi:hypothetical protein ALO36_103951 [Pseudomonas syringae pv. tomato]|nr:hypothetical protein PLA106_17989 [Pseudomonas amygdali pv. lachrymans str. M302278]KPY88561.1 hypothetical protein ALO36_103951 [Pseudomonas syringae pv. tomato]
MVPIHNYATFFIKYNWNMPKSMFIYFFREAFKITLINMLMWL